MTDSSFQPSEILCQ